jgi:hypothetical protein
MYSTFASLARLGPRPYVSDLNQIKSTADAALSAVIAGTCSVDAISPASWTTGGGSSVVFWENASPSTLRHSQNFFRVINRL